MMKTISIVCFSGRVKKGNCYEISLFLEKKLMNEFTNVHSFFLSEAEIHNCSHCDYECFSKERKCPYISDDISKLYREILKCDMSFFVIPIFSEFPCSNYFVFNERSQCFFSSEKQYEEYFNIPKKYIIIGNSGFSNAKTIILNNSKESQKADNNFLNICSNTVHEKSIQGNLMEYKTISDMVNLWVNQCFEEINHNV